ncbi:MAG: toll/interleukin-1 receptor domain-containing protein [Proteobacteria bacterium]|nr:toll/interleukin-1 receptor domain-containing protein [Pseudomonadota bacterium]
MATVIIIHAADDTLPARALAEKLRQAKLTVVLEKHGDDLREAARSAQAGVALWSPRSTGDAAIVDEVNFARGKTKLVHALMQNTPLPDPFRGDKAANLTGWRGEDDFPGWRELAKLVTDRAGVAPLPPPAARVASGFFQPGRVDVANTGAAGAKPAQPASRRAPPPPPAQQRQAAQSPPPRPAPPRTAAPPRDYAPAPEREKKGGGMVLVVVALIVLIAGGGGGYFWWSQQQSAHAASTAWESIDRNDPAALRAFIAAQSGPAKRQAETALSELEERSYEAASDTDTVEALQGFLRDFPQSQHALAARGRIAELQTAAANGAPATTTATATTQPANPDLNPPGSLATTTATTSATTTPAPTTGGPAPLTPPAGPSATQSPPSSPTTTP